MGARVIRRGSATALLAAAACTSEPAPPAVGPYGSTLVLENGTVFEGQTEVRFSEARPDRARITFSGDAGDLELTLEAHAAIEVVRTGETMEFVLDGRAAELGKAVVGSCPRDGDRCTVAEAGLVRLRFADAAVTGTIEGNSLAGELTGTPFVTCSVLTDTEGSLRDDPTFASDHCRPFASFGR